MHSVDDILTKFSHILDPLKKRIAVFEYVRNIPYASLDSYGPDKANCFAKSRLLSELLQHLGYKTRFLTIRYQLPSFPEEVRYIPGQIDYHHAIEALIDDSWITVDPTYDPPLEKLGFKVSGWDGIHSTALAVEALSVKREHEQNPMFDKEFTEFESAINEACKLYPSRLKTYSKKFNKILEEARN